MKAVSLSLWAICFVLVSTTGVFAQNPWDVEVQRLAKVARASIKSPEGMIPLLDLWQKWDRATPKIVEDALDSLTQSPGISPERRVYVQTLRAFSDLRHGDIDKAKASLKSLGFVTAWQMVGPFPNEGKTGLSAEVGPPESPLIHNPDTSYEGVARKVSWRALPESPAGAYVPFDNLFYPNENVCAIAETYVWSDAQTLLSAWVGASGAFALTWNGQEILRDEAYRQADPDRSAVKFEAAKGWNRLRIKVCGTTGPWGMYVRLGDARGGPPPALRMASQPEVGASIIAVTKIPPTTIATVLDVLSARVKVRRPKAQDDENLARFLAGSFADDPAEHAAAQAAQRAAESSPSPARLMLAARLAQSRAERMLLSERALALAPQNPEAQLLHARMRTDGYEPESALPVLERLSGATVHGIEAAYLRSQLLRSLDMSAAAFAQLEPILMPLQNAPFWRRALADAAQAAGYIDTAYAHFKALMQMRKDDLQIQRLLTQDALERGDTEATLAYLQDALKISQLYASQQLYAAKIYASLGRTKEAEHAFAMARTIAPDNPEVFSAEGQFFLWQGRMPEALVAFDRVLQLKPQDANTRSLVDDLKSRERGDESFAVPEAALLLRRVKPTPGSQATVLQDLTVHTVFQNGLGAEFRQIVAQIHTQEAVKRWRSFSVAYDPESQRVDVRRVRLYKANGQTSDAFQTYEQELGEPWYRMYYDQRALIMLTPELAVGDVVEYRYRLDDVAPRNQFADYFGDVAVVQGAEPKVQFDYVLIAPSVRDIYLHYPTNASFKHQTNIKDGLRTTHLSQTDVPALRSEPAMPGIFSFAGYIHASTYKSWNDVGRWYWGLIKDQLYADASLKRTVAELVRDAGDVKTKVERIHRWVVSHTRYVALEFGIHGYLPYRVPTVVQRGFGDCKDKASLLYTMLREAGIAADMVLVRTRQNGRIDTAPASLAVFDHVIAFVPELDLYLDGTAEQSGIGELPAQDQGIMVLHVNAKGSELRITPEYPASANQRQVILNFQLDSDGNAIVQGEEQVLGAEAASVRTRFAAIGTRKERLEQSLAREFPGAELKSFEVGDLDDLRQPAVIRYLAKVPQFSRPEGKRMALSLSTINSLTSDFATLPTREHDLDLTYARTMTESRSLTLPAGWRFSSVPASKQLDQTFGLISLETTQVGSSLTVKTTFALKSPLVRSKDYVAFRQWLTQADQLLRQPIIATESP